MEKHGKKRRARFQIKRVSLTKARGCKPANKPAVLFDFCVTCMMETWNSGEKLAWDQPWRVLESRLRRAWRDILWQVVVQVSNLIVSAWDLEKQTLREGIKDNELSGRWLWEIAGE